MVDQWRIRDSVFGYVSLSGTEVALINTSVFQRLRGIKQLALAYLVYPGAHHTRFEHSLGVCDIAGQIAEQLELSADHLRLVRLAALLHDLGHGPFSHVSEEILDMHVSEQIEEETHKIHEEITHELILKTDEITPAVISKRDAEQIVNLLKTGWGEPALRAIVSGPLDADKQDYLLRDSYYCGVPYGIYDMEHLIHEILTVEDPAEKRKQLGITQDGIRALEQFLLAKYYLTTQVYQHKVRLITDQMIIRAVKLGIRDDQIPALIELYTYKKGINFLNNYITYDDSKLFNTICSDEYNTFKCYRIFNKLRKRKLFKQVFKRALSELNLSAATKEILGKITKPAHIKKRELLEAHLSKLLIETLEKSFTKKRVWIPEGLDEPGYFIVNSYEIKHVRARTTDNVGELLVDYDPPRPFEQTSALYRAIKGAIEERYLEIYAPIEYDEPGVRLELMKKLEEPVIDLLRSFGEESGSDKK